MESRSELGNFFMGPPEASFDYLKKKLEKLMPHDRDGKLIQVGDFVSVTFEVKEINMAEDYCNTTLIIPGQNGPHNVVSTLIVNAKQTKVIPQGQTVKQG